MSKDDEKELTPDELEALEIWTTGKSMIEAYTQVMSKYRDLSTLPKQTLNKRVQRFFASPYLKMAMVDRDDERKKNVKAIELKPIVDQIGPKIQQIVDEEKKKRKDAKRIEKKKKADERKAEEKSASHFFDTIVRPNLTTTPKAPPKEKEVQETDVQIATSILNKVSSEIEKPSPELETILEPKKTAKEKWLESLLITDEPTPMSVYGTGQFMMSQAVNEIIKRDKEIKKKGISVLSKDGSVFTPTIISAMKTAASMIIPFVPTQEAIKDNGTATAVTLLGLMQDKIDEDPDAYTAPIPPTVTIDVTPKDGSKE
jgi:hypothetical protein